MAAKSHGEGEAPARAAVSLLSALWASPACARLNTDSMVWNGRRLDLEKAPGRHLRLRGPRHLRPSSGVAGPLRRVGPADRRGRDRDRRWVADARIPPELRASTSSPSLSARASFGAVDISLVVAVPNAIGAPVGPAFDNSADDAPHRGPFNASEKVYLVYYDGPTGQDGWPAHLRPGRSNGGGFCYPDSRSSTSTRAVRKRPSNSSPAYRGDSRARPRPRRGRVFGAPHLGNSGHVCDVPPTTSWRPRSLGEPSSRPCARGGSRDDYYGHSGTWPDVQDSFFLERLDSPDRAPPSTPCRASTSKAPPRPAPRASRGRRLYGRRRPRLVPDLRRTTNSSTPCGQPRPPCRCPSPARSLTKLSIRSRRRPCRAISRRPAREIFFKGGLGVVDARGRLLRDTVPPPAPGAVTVIRLDQAGRRRLVARRA